MVKFLSAVMVVACLFIGQAKAENVLVAPGIFGMEVAPMKKIQKLIHKGDKVYYVPWYAVGFLKVHIDRAIGHSKGADAILTIKAKRYIPIDATVANRGCPKKGACVSYYNPKNKIPLGVCCGGWPVKGAVNKKRNFSHLDIADGVAREAVNEMYR